MESTIDTNITQTVYYNKQNEKKMRKHRYTNKHICKVQNQRNLHFTMSEHSGCRPACAHAHLISTLNFRIRNNAYHQLIRLGKLEDFFSHKSADQSPRSCPNPINAAAALTGQADIVT